MGKPIGKHKDGSNCYTRNCSLDHFNVESQIMQLQANITNAFQKPEQKQPISKNKTHRSLEYGTPEYKFFCEKAEQSESTMTGKEYKAVSEYTGWAFKHYYAYFEGKHSDGSPFGSKLDAPLKEQLTRMLEDGANNIDNFIARSGRFSKPVTVYRGEKPPKGVSVADHLAKTYPIGGEIEIKRYLSTTMDPKIASEITNSTSENYILVIDTKEGAMLGENISEQGLREKEVLLPRNKKYKVSHISNDTIQWGPNKKTHVTVHLTAV